MNLKIEKLAFVFKNKPPPLQLLLKCFKQRINLVVLGVNVTCAKNDPYYLFKLFRANTNFNIQWVYPLCGYMEDRSQKCQYEESHREEEHAEVVEAALTH